MLYRDTLFSSSIVNPINWQFDSKVAKVFPDMIKRSVPGYSTIVSMIGKLAKHFVQKNTYIYDLGCSLGAVTFSIIKNLRVTDCKIIAIDNSPAMIAGCKKKLNKHKLKTSIEIVEANICNINIKNASLVILNFTLQFIHPDERNNILTKIYNGLNTGGALILSEKFNFADDKIEKLMFIWHDEFKKTNGYSELEISQKRTMLKNVMLTDTIENHKKKLSDTGFAHAELWYQYFNFGSFIAIKT
ncbi:MAG: carboxy-S-adenosyl-L-methionine synthase CmoA [Candidatus Dasytiphilus stammeri]